MSFTHLISLMLLHYLVKIETLKMHANTNSAFNIKSHKIAIDSLIKCSVEPHNTNKE